MTRRVHSRSKTWRRVFHGTVVGRKVFLRLRPRRVYGASCKKAFTKPFRASRSGPGGRSKGRGDPHPPGGDQPSPGGQA
ncbi:MAG: hypothetical protein KM312_00285 [Hydrogenibacillus schlegelii]|uniref:Uncharacterized protein n=1 Tax=Hydrogenibacillus schlegelii TaxID=1484 RepID=A0A947GGL6_HYDSH|nr:hypothetical protein [Hydrogenibacillus schlegelii]